jgi:hypothetical protein
LDGESLGEFDLYAPTILRQQPIVTMDSLTDGEHTLRIVVTGKKNPKATDCYVDVDALVISTKLFTLDGVSESLRVITPSKADTTLAFTPIPSAYTVSILKSSHPDLISLDGKLSLPSESVEVELTLAISDGMSTVTKTVKVELGK